MEVLPIEVPSPQHAQHSQEGERQSNACLGPEVPAQHSIAPEAVTPVGGPAAAAAASQHVAAPERGWEEVAQDDIGSPQQVETASNSLATSAVHLEAVDSQALDLNAHKSCAAVELPSGDRSVLGPPPGLDEPEPGAGWPPGLAPAALLPLQSEVLGNVALVPQDTPKSCDQPPELTKVLAQALALPPEQLLQLVRDAPPALSLVYRDLLSLQGSLQLLVEPAWRAACICRA